MLRSALALLAVAIASATPAPAGDETPLVEFSLTETEAVGDAVSFVGLKPGLGVADDFVAPDGAAIRGVDCLGTFATFGDAIVFCQCFDAPPRFRVRYLESASGLPGKALASFEDSALHVIRHRTGRTLDGGNPEVLWRFVHAPVDVAPGQVFWIEITPLDLCPWAPEGSNLGNEIMLIDSDSNGYDDGDAFFGTDLALAPLTDAPVDQFSTGVVVPELRDCDLDGEDDRVSVLQNRAFDANRNGLPDRCEQQFDADLDAIPDDLDLCPYVFGDACVLDIRLTQLDWFDAEENPLQIDSAFGQLQLTVAHPGDHTLFFNMEANGEHVIVNMPVFADEERTGFPTITVFTLFPLDEPGIDVTQLDTRVSLTLAPQLSGVPKGAPFEIRAVEPEMTITGQFGVGDPVAPAGRPLANFDLLDNSEEALWAWDAYGKPAFDPTDLDEANEKEACGPASVAASFDWLNRTFCLGVDDLDDREATVDDLRTRMGSNSCGRTELFHPALPLTSSRKDFYKGKRTYINDKQMPIELSGQGFGFGESPDEAIDPCKVLDAVAAGCDIEMLTNWTDSQGASGEHYIAISGAIVVYDENDNKSVSVRIEDDGDQRHSGGTRSTIAKFEQDANDKWGLIEREEDGSVKTTYQIVGWVCQKPTFRTVEKAMIDKREELKTKLAEARQKIADGQTPTCEELCCILSMAQRVSYLSGVMWGQFYQSFDPGDGPIPVGVIDFAMELYLELTSAEDFALDAMETGNCDPENCASRQAQGPVDLVVLDAVLSSLELIVLRSEQLMDQIDAMLPVDTDRDGVPDEADNCPDIVNTDQNDCDDDGIGDACEIAGGAPDKNNDGVPDDCEETDACATDFDGNGVVNAADVGAFISQYFVDLAEGTLITDFDNNGVVNAADVGAFLSQYFEDLANPLCSQ